MLAFRVFMLGRFPLSSKPEKKRESCCFPDRCRTYPRPSRVAITMQQLPLVLRSLPKLYPGTRYMPRPSRGLFLYSRSTGEKLIVTLSLPSPTDRRPTCCFCNQLLSWRDRCWFFSSSSSWGKFDLEADEICRGCRSVEHWRKEDQCCCMMRERAFEVKSTTRCFHYTEVLGADGPCCCCIFYKQAQETCMMCVCTFHFLISPAQSANLQTFIINQTPDFALPSAAQFAAPSSNLCKVIKPCFGSTVHTHVCL